jgi:hypothetical protein
VTVGGTTAAAEDDGRARGGEAARTAGGGAAAWKDYGGAAARKSCGGVRDGCGGARDSWEARLRGRETVRRHGCGGGEGAAVLEKPARVRVRRMEKKTTTDVQLKGLDPLFTR